MSENSVILDLKTLQHPEIYGRVDAPEMRISELKFCVKCDRWHLFLGANFSEAASLLMRNEKLNCGISEMRE